MTLIFERGWASAKPLLFSAILAAGTGCGTTNDGAANQAGSGDAGAAGSGVSGGSGQSGAGTSGQGGSAGQSSAGTSGQSGSAGQSGAGTSGQSGSAGQSGAGTSGQSGNGGAGVSGQSGSGGQSGAGTSGQSGNGGAGVSGQSGSGGQSGAGTGGQSGNGGAGVSGQSGSGGGGTGGASTGPHQFTTGGLSTAPYRYTECTSNDTCPSGERCLKLTQELSVCDAPLYQIATACGNTAVPDQCGCMGKTCAGSAVCASTEPNCGCSPTNRVNICVDSPCATAGDCTGGKVCSPQGLILGLGERCFTPACAADSECTMAPGGRCGMILAAPSQAGQVSLVGVRCLYPGAAGNGCYSDYQGGQWCQS